MAKSYKCTQPTKVTIAYPAVMKLPPNGNSKAKNY